VANHYQHWRSKIQAVRLGCLFRSEKRTMAARRDASVKSTRSTQIRFPFTIFLSAFLLFWTQLILGKYILPWFGGTPAVWTTCMLFFQVLLLAGYTYAHLLTRHFSAFVQSFVHCTILLTSVLFLCYLATIWNSPITPNSDWKPVGEVNPVLRIIELLAVGVGLPYFALSATGPLLQAWYDRAASGDSTYRLYFISNLGSFLALFAFPALLEPRLALKAQGRLWSAAYLMFAVTCAVCAFRAVRSELLKSVGSQSESAGLQEAAPHAPSASPRIWRHFLWFGLSACASIVFLSTTNQMCQDVAVIPLLWVLPLAIYLLSFILCFEHQRWYARSWFHATFGLALFAACYVLYDGAVDSIFLQASIYLFVLFVVCMICNGELARSKPHPRSLTSFYLTVAAGGAFGGVFVALLAPQIFSGFWEYQLGLGIAAVLLLLILVRDPESWLYRSVPPVPVIVLAMAAMLPEAASLAARRANGVLCHLPAFITTSLLVYVFLHRKRGAPEKARKRAAPLCCVAAVLVAALTLIGTGLAHARKSLAQYRNFYGVLSVFPQDSGDPVRSALRLVHGRISHGLQLRSATYRRSPTSYYASSSGVGLAIQLASASARQEQRRLRLGVVGLGVGTIAAYGQPGDLIRFYEINPQVTQIASNTAYFTYLADSPAVVQVVAGDARQSLERESNRGELQNFDVLVIDAFNGDSIPVHLLTQEAIALYLHHLRQPGGILAFHITNTYLDLRPVLLTTADHFGLNIVWVHSKGDGLLSYECDWILLSHGELPPGGQDSSLVGRPGLSLPAIRPWTDDYSNLLQILRR